MPARVDGALQWKQFLKKCFEERVDGDRFETFAKLLQSQTAVSGSTIADVILKGHLRSRKGGPDPILWQYLRRLVALDFVHGYDLLTVVLEHCKGHTEQNGEVKRVQGVDTSENIEINLEDVSLDFKEKLLTLLYQVYAGHQVPKSRDEIQSTLEAIAMWMIAFYQNHQRATLADVAHGEVQFQDPREIMLQEAVGMMLSTLAENERVRQVLDTGLESDVQEKLSDALSKFTAMLAGSSSQLSHRLDFLQHSYQSLQHQTVSALDDSASDAVDLRELQLNNINDREAIKCRASLTVYIDAILDRLPHANTQKVYQYLQTRFQGDTGNLMSDLITSSFDLLITASNRGDSSDKLFMTKSFIVNKLPLLLSLAISMSFSSIDTSFLLSEALVRVDPTLYHGFVPGFALDATSSNFVSEMRRDFVLACALHGLITPGQVQQLLRSDAAPTQPQPQRSRMHKETLVKVGYGDMSKVEPIIRDMEALDGNAGANAEAVGEMLHEMFASRDTSSLKAICHILAPRAQALDALFLFNDASALLGPLCSLIDEWKYEEDQVEHQPNYDEFSACLTLLLACVQRFGLRGCDLHLSEPGSFLRWFLDSGATAEAIEHLSSEQEKHFTDWTRGLFEIEGITDDLISDCPPHAFYRMVPTIFSQVVLASRTATLPFDKIQSGLELLLETLVIPSIVLGFRYLIDHVWRNEKDLEVVLEMIKVLIRPASTQGEARSMHRALLCVAADDLYRFFQHFQQTHSPHKDLSPLLEQVAKHADYCRATARISHTALNWDDASPPTLLTQLGNHFNALISWSMPGYMSALPLYSHANLLTTLRLCGTQAVLSSLLSLLSLHMQSGTGDVALDIAASVICAHETQTVAYGTASTRGFVSLRDALHHAHAQAKEIINSDPVRAQNIVLLHRRVEDQVGAHDLQMPMAMQMDLPSDLQHLDLAQASVGPLGHGTIDGLVSADGTAPAGVDMGRSEDVMDFSGGGDHAFDLAMEGSFDVNIGDDVGVDDLFADADAAGQEGPGFQAQHDGIKTQQQRDEEQIFGEQAGRRASAVVFGEAQQQQQRKASETGVVEEGTEDDFWDSLGAGDYDSNMGF